MGAEILEALLREIDREMDRRSFLRWAGLGGASALLAPGLASGAEKVPFRMDEINAVHYLPTHFIPQFLTRPIGWEFKAFATSGHGRVSAFTRGAIDGFATAWSYLVTIAVNDLPGMCVAGVGGGGSRVLATPKSNVRRLADLKGKKVGVVKFSSQDVMLIYALKGLGLDPFKDVERLNLGNPAGVVAAMSTDRVDACAIWEPYGSILLLKHGARMISDLGKDAFGYSHGGMYIRDGFLQKHPDLAQDIVNGVVKSIDYVLKNKAAWVARARKVTGQDQEVVEAAIANSYPSYQIPLQTVRSTAKAMYELGVEKKDVSETIHKKVTYAFLEKATGKRKEELGYA